MKRITTLACILLCSLLAISSMLDQQTCGAMARTQNSHVLFGDLIIKESPSGDMPIPSDTVGFAYSNQFLFKLYGNPCQI